MNDKEAIDMMYRCISELEMKRQVISVLQPQAEAYEVIRDIVRMANRGGGMSVGEDLVWRLKKKIEELQPKPTSES